MPREITTHKVNALNEQLLLQAMDDLDPAGLALRYQVTWTNQRTATPGGLVVTFQDGTVDTAGTNGVSNEVLLSIVQDRLTTLQLSPTASSHYAQALTSVKEALFALEVEGEAQA